MAPPPRPRTLVTAPFRGPGLVELEQIADVVLDPWLDHRPVRIYDEAGLAARLDDEGATVVICEADRCAGPVLELPLTAIGSTRGDPTNVDIDEATARGIPVLHAPGRNADAVAELTVGLLLAVVRGLPAADRAVRAGEIYRDATLPYQRFRGPEIAGLTAGLVGLGAVGRAVRWRLEGLGMDVVAHDPYAVDATLTLDELLAAADVVSVHAAVTAESVGLMGASQFAAMKPGSYYLNAARAALHDLGALTEALTSGHLAGAGLDHFDGEVLAEDHPLTTMDHVALTPHIGGATFETEANHSRMISADLARLLAGERPAHIANPEVLS